MKISELVKIEWKEALLYTITWYPEVEKLCYRKYDHHPKGCPNIRKCHYEQPIPNFGYISENGNYNYYYLIYAKFDFKTYKEFRKEENPNWSEDQVKCVLYWQNSVKKLLSDYINNLQLDFNQVYILGCGSGLRIKGKDYVGSMENAYINVFSTMKRNGIKMEIKPKNIIYLVCLICSRNKINFNNNSLEKWIK